MNVLISKQRPVCSKCYGYGVHSVSDPNECGVCGSCGSFHPERLSLKYKEEKSNDNFMFFLSSGDRYNQSHPQRRTLFELLQSLLKR